MIKIGMASLGCPKNQVDAEMILSKLKDKGYEITPYEQEAQVIIVNTCGFIESAKQESIDTVLELAELKQTGKLKCLIVTGCLAERYREQLKEEIPEIDTVVSIGRNDEIADIIEKSLGGQKDDCFGEKENLPLCGGRVLISEPYFAYIKIAEGCNNRCTYCAIPSIRGRLRSRTVESVVEEAKTLAQKGVKELIVVAQDTTRYGEDIYGECRLSQLLTELCKIDGIHWIRLLYAYPDRLTDDIIDVMAREPKIVKYIDLPIQHCCGEVLSRMNRPGDRESLEKTIEKLRKKIPGITVRTTLIAGFPGETEEQFCALSDFVKNMRFERLGCFAYSAEEGTPAAEFDNQLSEQEKNKRAEIIMDRQAVISDELSEQKVGQSVEVLVEGYDTYIKHFYGRTPADAPDIDCKIFFKSKNKPSPGDFVKVRVTDVLDMDLLGEEEA